MKRKKKKQAKKQVLLLPSMADLNAWKKIRENADRDYVLTCLEREIQLENAMFKSLNPTQIAQLKTKIESLKASLK